MSEGAGCPADVFTPRSLVCPGVYMSGSRRFSLLEYVYLRACVCGGEGGGSTCVCVCVCVRVCVHQSVGARACVCTCVGEAFIKTLLLDSFLFSGGDCLCFSTLFLKLKSSISAF